MKVYKQINNELIELYFDLCNFFYKKQKIEGWGTRILEKISKELIKEFGNNSGYSIRNIKYMVKFYKTYNKVPKMQQLVAQIPWWQNIVIMDKCKNIEERAFYINLTINKGLGRN